MRGAAGGVRRRGARLTPRGGFWTVAAAFASVMAFSSAPTPLYLLYQERNGFATPTITVVFASYAVGVIVSLFLVGHLSDRTGRRRAVLAGVALAAAVAVVFVAWPATAGLVVARLLTGVAVGVVSATATAWLTELDFAARPGAGTRRAAAVATVANLGGLAVGPLVAGPLAEWAPAPLALPYLVFLGLMALAIAATPFVPETRRPPAERPPYRPQRIAVPRSARGAYAAAALGALVSFAALGLFSALAPTFLDALGESSRALAGATAAVVFGGAATAQLLVGGRAGRPVLLLTAGILVAGLTLTAAAVWLPDPSVALFVLGGAVTGAGAGLCFKVTLGVVVAIAPPDRRAETLAGFFLAAYVGLVLPVIGLGVAVEVVGPRTALLGFAALALAGVAAAIRRLWRDGRHAAA